MSASNNECESVSLYDESVMNLSLDEYYERYVTPPDSYYWRNYSLKAQRRRHYYRTHYFSPDYIKVRQSQKTGYWTSARTLQNDINRNTDEETEENDHT